MQKRYLTQITEDQRAWINGAAKELDWNASDVVQLAIEELRKEKWDTVKKDIANTKLANELAEIKEKQEALKQREGQIHATMSEGGFIRL